MKSANILIADEHEWVRLGPMRILSASHPEWRVVDAVSTGLAAIELGLAARPTSTALKSLKDCMAPFQASAS